MYLTPPLALLYLGVMPKNRLRDIRLSLGVTQEDLWKATGVGLATLSRIENNHVTPRVYTKKKIAHALGVPLKSIWPPVRPRR